MAIEIDHLWAPSPDDEIKSRANSYIRDLKLYDRLLQSGTRELGNFSPDSKLYILAHGHSEIPAFSNKNGKWTATQLANMLSGDGLPNNHREIELLVCHAGESVNNKKTGEKLLRTYQNYEAAKSGNRNVSKFKKLYNKINKKSTSPTFFEDDPEKLLIPLAAQLVQSLKYIGYTNVRVISYKCPVAQYSAGGEVYLDLSKKGGRWGVKAKDHSQYRVVWL